MCKQTIVAIYVPFNKRKDYLMSDSTTVPLAAAKIRGPRDAFKKGFQK